MSKAELSYTDGVPPPSSQPDMLNIIPIKSLNIAAE